MLCRKNAHVFFIIDVISLGVTFLVAKANTSGVKLWRISTQIFYFRHIKQENLRCRKTAKAEFISAERYFAASNTAGGKGNSKTRPMGWPRMLKGEIDVNDTRIRLGVAALGMEKNGWYSLAQEKYFFSTPKC